MVSGRYLTGFEQLQRMHIMKYLVVKISEADCKAGNYCERDSEMLSRLELCLISDLPE